jgi:hypothetical protein
MRKNRSGGSRITDFRPVVHDQLPRVSVACPVSGNSFAPTPDISAFPLHAPRPGLATCPHETTEK